MRSFVYLVMVLALITTSACAPTARVNISQTQVDDLMRKAAAGDSASQAGLGFLFYDGVGVKQDYAEALKWWSDAAKQGNAMAQTQLGLMYVTGKGIAINYAEAKKWLEAAAAQGNPQGEYNLGLMYLKGIGVAEDSNKALQLFTSAASHGHKGAAALMQKVNSKMQQHSVLPGQSYATKRLVYDALPSVLMKATMRLGRQCPSQNQHIVSSRITQGTHSITVENTQRTAWTEAWTIDACGQEVTIAIQFISDADGMGTTFIIQ